MIKSFLRPVIVGTLISVIAALFFLLGSLDSWSLRATDKFFLPRASDPSITIVAIDDASITQLGRWPWPRNIHADLIKKLKDAGASVIGYDVNFPESSNSDDDEALAEFLKDAGNVVLPIELKLIFKDGQYVYDESQVLAPIPLLSFAALSTGHSNTPPDTDGIVRRIPLYVRATGQDGSYIPSFSGEVYKYAAGSDRVILDAPKDSGGRMLISFPDRPFNSFQTISAVDILRDRADLSRIKNGVVFVGATASDLHDSNMVPTSGGVPMPGVEIHASIFDTLQGQHFLKEVSRSILALIIILLGALIGFFVAMFRARYNLPLSIILWITFVIIAFAMFDRGKIIDVVWPSLAIIFSYAGVTLERRISADREKRKMKAAFSRYVSASVVESILKNPDKLKLGGEKREMSVLFSDIRGFTSISEGLTPEKLVELLNRYLGRMTDIVFKHEGVLDKYIGDAVMAFWNAPLNQEDHALRAVATGLAMRENLQEMNAQRVFGDIEIKIGIGINSGDMVVGNIGGDARFEYTVIGDNVNLASRLESLTKEYGVWVLVTEFTRAKLKDEYLLRRLDKVAVKGKKEPVMIFEVLELASKATTDQKSLAQEFESALDAYFAKDFADAVVKCDELLKKYPNDGPSRTLRERSSLFLQEPPLESWDGTWVYTKK
ncbi:MAG: adenylate/guanylate cyclase domain-containing protein [Patescibacteria group bacterium]